MLTGDREEDLLFAQGLAQSSYQVACSYPASLLPFLLLSVAWALPALLPQFTLAQEFLFPLRAVSAGSRVQRLGKRRCAWRILVLGRGGATPGLHPVPGHHGGSECICVPVHMGLCLVTSNDEDQGGLFVNL